MLWTCVSRCSIYFIIIRLKISIIEFSICYAIAHIFIFQNQKGGVTSLFQRYFRYGSYLEHWYLLQTFKCVQVLSPCFIHQLLIRSIIPPSTLIELLHIHILCLIINWCLFESIVWEVSWFPKFFLEFLVKSLISNFFKVVLVWVPYSSRVLFLSLKSIFCAFGSLNL